MRVVGRQGSLCNKPMAALEANLASHICPNNIVQGTHKISTALLKDNQLGCGQVLTAVVMDIKFRSPLNVNMRF
jgi:hypothetical protein